LPVEQQVVIIYAGTNGYLDGVAVNDVRRAEGELHRFMTSRYGTVLEAIRTKKTLDDEIKAQLNAALKEFLAQYAAAGSRA